MINALRRLLDRIPRLTRQIGIEDKGKIEWGYVSSNLAEDVRAEQEVLDDYGEGGQIVTRLIWISPARLEANGEFQGW